MRARHQLWAAGALPLPPVAFADAAGCLPVKAAGDLACGKLAAGDHVRWCSGGELRQGRFTRAPPPLLMTQAQTPPPCGPLPPRTPAPTPEPPPPPLAHPPPAAQHSPTRP